MADEIKITLETLYDVLRNEKKREDLQKLEDTFFIDVVSYLREKIHLLKSQEGQDNPFTAGSKEKLEYELRSIRRILKEIYEKREKKIIDIALNRSKTGSDIIDTSSLLREEKDFYNLILDNLDLYRKGIFWKLYNAQLPDITGQRINLKLVEPKESAEKEVIKEPPKIVEGDKEFIEKEEKTPALNLVKTNVAKESNESEEPKDKLSLEKIKFLHPVPSFVWKDMKVYGPFEQGDETEIFPEVAALLVRKGRAEKV